MRRFSIFTTSINSFYFILVVFFTLDCKANIFKGMSLGLSAGMMYDTKLTDPSIFHFTTWTFDRGYIIDRSFGKPVGNFEINLNTGYRIEKGRKPNKFIFDSNGETTEYLNYISRTIPILVKVLYYYDLARIKPFIGVGVGTTRVNLDLQLESNPSEVERLVEKFKPTLSAELGILFNFSDRISIGIGVEKLMVQALTAADLKAQYSETYSKDEKIDLKTGQISVKILTRILL